MSSSTYLDHSYNVIRCRVWYPGSYTSSRPFDFLNYVEQYEGLPVSCFNRDFVSNVGSTEVDPFKGTSHSIQSGCVSGLDLILAQLNSNRRLQLRSWLRHPVGDVDLGLPNDDIDPDQALLPLVTSSIPRHVDIKWVRHPTGFATLIRYHLVNRLANQRSFDVRLPRHPLDLVFAIKCIDLVVANFDILRNVTPTSTSAIDATSKGANLRPRPRWRSIPDTLRVSRGPLRRTGPAPTSLSHGAFVLLVGFGLPRDSRLFPIRLHLNPNDPVGVEERASCGGS
ncbi:hypothetical protein ACFE04_001482 [Oxalis oulophora]